MRKSKFIEIQIVPILKQVEGGRLVKDMCRELGISEATYYTWKSKYGGMAIAGKRKRHHCNDFQTDGYNDDRSADEMVG